MPPGGGLAVPPGGGPLQGHSSSGRQANAASDQLVDVGREMVGDHQGLEVAIGGPAVPPGAGLALSPASAGDGQVPSEKLNPFEHFNYWRDPLPFLDLCEDIEECQSVVQAAITAGVTRDTEPPVSDKNCVSVIINTIRKGNINSRTKLVDRFFAQVDNIVSKFDLQWEHKNNSGSEGRMNFCFFSSFEANQFFVDISNLKKVNNRKVKCMQMSESQLDQNIQ